jgi:hypothetical protein
VLRISFVLRNQKGFRGQTSLRNAVLQHYSAEELLYRQVISVPSEGRAGRWSERKKVSVQVW